MTLSMSLLWKAPDSSALVNGRLKDVAAKGFVTGGDVTRVIGSLEVDVSSFVCITNDGAVVRSDATERLTVSDAVLSYIVLRARYVTLGSPILTLQVLDDTSYLADPEGDWLHVLATVDLTAGGPYSDVPAANIFYEERHEVDQQGRSNWRPSVANFGALPMPPGDHNRDGDIRVTLDTRSLYVWEEATSTWDLFDEVPLTNHRLLEHSNGIVAGATATSVEPSVSGLSDMVIGAVPVGPPDSGYIVAGKYVTAPAAPATVSALTFASRGLLQVYADEFGAIAASYRVELTTAPTLLNVLIVDISDDHEVVAGMVLSGTATTLSWNGGSPVTVVSGGRYKLYRPDGVQWIEVLLTGASVGAAETYEVFASQKNDQDYFLIAHYFWNGSNQLLVGTDRRVFGTLGAAELSSEFREEDSTRVSSDLRGSMVFSGGTVTNLAGLQVRVTGPLVAYVLGRRFVVPLVNGADRGYTGITLPDNATTKLYVDQEGVFRLGSYPAFEAYATIAEVTTAAGAVTTIVDERDPQLVVGNATRTARIWFTGLDAVEWDPANSRLSVKANGLVGPTKLAVGGVEATTVTATGAVNADGGVDRSTAAVLTIGGTNATRVDLAKAGVETRVKGLLTADGGVDRSTAAVLSIGATTASNVWLGRIGYETAVLGYLNVAGLLTPLGGIDKSGILSIGSTLSNSIWISRSGITTTIFGSLDVVETLTAVSIQRASSGEIAIGTGVDTTSVSVGRSGVTSYTNGSFRVMQNLQLDGGVITRATSGSLSIGATSIVTSIQMGQTAGTVGISGSVLSLTGPTTGASSANILIQSTASGGTKSVNIATNGLSGSTTTVNIASSGSSDKTVRVGDTALTVYDGTTGKIVSLPAVHQFIAADAAPLAVDTTATVFTKTLISGTYRIKVLLLYASSSIGIPVTGSLHIGGGSLGMWGIVMNGTAGNSDNVHVFKDIIQSTHEINAVDTFSLVSGVNVAYPIYFDGFITLYGNQTVTISVKNLASSSTTLVLCRGSFVDITGVNV